MSVFKDAQIEQLLSSGWSTSVRVAGLVQERGLPAISRGYLARALRNPTRPAGLARPLLVPASFAESWTGVPGKRLPGALLHDSVRWIIDRGLRLEPGSTVETAPAKSAKRQALTRSGGRNAALEV
jgi:hypothetical protein